jgi:hypothetical protein
MGEKVPLVLSMPLPILLLLHASAVLIAFLKANRLTVHPNDKLPFIMYRR